MKIEVSKKYIKYLLIFLLFVAIIIRLTFVFAGSKYNFHMDEKFNIDNTLAHLESRFLLPPYYYGPIIYYLISIPLFVLYIFNSIINLNFSLGYFISLYFNQFEFFIILPRLFFVFISFITLFLFYKVCLFFFKEQLFSLILLLFFAFSYGDVVFSATLKIESFLTFLVVALMYISLRFYDNCSKHYFKYSVLFGLLLAVSFASKYNYLIFFTLWISALFIIYLIKTKNYEIFLKISLWTILFSFIFLFIVYFQFIIHFADLKKYIDWVFESPGHIGASYYFNILNYFNSYYTKIGLVLIIFFIISLLLIQKSKYKLILFPILLVFFANTVFLYWYVLKYYHYIIPFMPVLFLVSGFSLKYIYDKHKIIRFCLYLFLIVFIFSNVNKLYNRYNRINTIPICIDVKEWIEENIEKNSRFLIEPYFSVDLVHNEESINHLINWYKYEYDKVDKGLNQSKVRYYELYRDYKYGEIKYFLYIKNIFIEGREMFEFELNNQWRNKELEYALINRRFYNRFFCEITYDDRFEDYYEQICEFYTDIKSNEIVKTWSDNNNFYTLYRLNY